MAKNKNIKLVEFFKETERHPLAAVAIHDFQFRLISLASMNVTWKNKKKKW